MKHFILLALCLNCFNTNGQKSYRSYHESIINTEELIADQAYNKAIGTFDSLFQAYPFVFLRDCKLATELAVFMQDDDAAFRFLQKGVQMGWSLKSIKKNKRLKAIRKNPKWPKLEADYDSLHELFIARINQPLRTKTKELSKKDQLMALKALFRIGDKNQIKYAEKKFAPHSEKQLQELMQILEDNGYPGEKLVGYSWWASVILSHHNSISKTYVKADTLYPNMRPHLQEAMIKGELHPYQFAIMEDWRRVTANDNQTAYGYLGEISTHTDLEQVNNNRKAVGLRSINVRNKLLDVEQATGLNLYLPKNWQKGKIMVTSENKPE